jgi:class 3 adenylate cyclase
LSFLLFKAHKNIQHIIKKQALQKQTLQIQNRILETLKLYFPKRILTYILSTPSYPFLAKRKKITLLFCDLCQFTQLSEQLPPSLISDILNRFLSKMDNIIDAYGGILNEIVGDGLVILLGALDHLSPQNQAHRAARLALDMQKTMLTLQKEWNMLGIEYAIQLRIGIHQDNVTLGSFGSDKRRVFRAMGQGVNIAARLEKYSKPNEILVSYSIYSQCSQHFSFSSLKKVHFKGSRYEYDICCLLSEKNHDTIKIKEQKKYIPLLRAIIKE